MTPKILRKLLQDLKKRYGPDAECVKIIERKQKTATRRA